MNAVNLAPREKRGGSPKLSVAKPTLGLLGGLVLVLAAVVLYVSTADKVHARSKDLSRIDATVTAWNAAASSYSSYVTAAQQRSQQLAAIKSLVTSRFPWETLLSQISGVMPATAALSSLQASTSTAGTTSGASNPTSSSGSTAGASTASNAPTVQLGGCAQTQAVVAQTMDRLREITGVTDVALASSTYSPQSAGGSGSAGQCPFPVQFQMTLTLGTATASGTSSPAPAASSAGSSAASGTSSPSPTASASASTPTVAAQ